MSYVGNSSNLFYQPKPGIMPPLQQKRRHSQVLHPYSRSQRGLRRWFQALQHLQRTARDRTVCDESIQTSVNRPFAHHRILHHLRMAWSTLAQATRTLTQTQCWESLCPLYLQHTPQMIFTMILFTSTNMLWLMTTTLQATCHPQ
jgi:hypothetical protein